MTWFFYHHFFSNSCLVANSSSTVFAQHCTFIWLSWQAPWSLCQRYHSWQSVNLQPIYWNWKCALCQVEIAPLVFSECNREGGELHCVHVSCYYERHWRKRTQYLDCHPTLPVLQNLDQNEVVGKWSCFLFVCFFFLYKKYASLDSLWSCRCTRANWCSSQPIVMFSFDLFESVWSLCIDSWTAKYKMDGETDDFESKQLVNRSLIKVRKSISVQEQWKLWYTVVCDEVHQSLWLHGCRACAHCLLVFCLAPFYMLEEHFMFTAFLLNESKACCEKVKLRSAHRHLAGLSYSLSEKKRSVHKTGYRAGLWKRPEEISSPVAFDSRT